MGRSGYAIRLSRTKYKVLFQLSAEGRYFAHQDASQIDARLENRYDDAKLSWLQRNKKTLIVIDESHNLRNEKSSRCQDLLSSLVQNQEGQENRDVKVLMLSATPINTGLNDVKGRINSSVRCRSSSLAQLANISFRFSVDIMNASLYPVSIPRYILISQSFKGIPTASIFRLMLSSIGDRITQESEPLNDASVADC